MCIRDSIYVNGATVACSPALALSPTEWRRLTVTTTTAVTANLSIFLTPTGSNALSTTGMTGDYLFDGAMLRSGSTASTYADGNSSNWIWNGTTNNSSSTGPEF